MKKLLMSLIITALLCGCNSKITAKNETLVNGEKNISMNDVSFCVEKTDIRTEVKPNKPSGYYNYYEKKDGFYYYAVMGSANNHGSYPLQTGKILVQGFNGNSRYEGKLVFLNREESDLVKEIKKGETLKFYFIILIEDGDPIPDKVKIYYTKKFETPKNRYNYDELLSWTLPVL